MDPYAAMGVSPGASDEEIAKAYRELAKRYHPDLHPGDRAAAERMSAINRAYEQIKTQRQSGNRRNSEPQRPSYEGAAADAADVEYGPFDPFAYYRRQQYSRYQPRRGGAGGMIFVVFLMFLLLRLLVGLMLGGYTYDYLYGSRGGVQDAPYGYYQQVP